MQRLGVGGAVRVGLLGATLRLRKLAMGGELKLVRSHPKDDRGSLRGIGLWPVGEFRCVRQASPHAMLVFS